MEANESILQRHPLREAGLSYSLAAILVIALSLVVSCIVGIAGGEGAAETDWFKYISFLLPQIAFAAVCVVFFRRLKTPARTIYRPAKWHYFLLAAAMQFGLLFSLNFLNDYFVKFLEHFGYTSSMEGSVPTLDGWNLLPAVLIIALLPAVFEETLFRGVVFGSMQASGWGTWKAVLISGALFSLFHGNPDQTIYQFVCGACFALLAQRAGSLLPGMLAHFLNNGVILTLASVGVDLDALSLAGKSVLFSLSGACLIASFVFLVFDKKNVKGELSGAKLFFLTASVGILVCAVEWAVALVGGFLS